MSGPRFVVYEAKDGWRWRLLAANGRIVADSGEAYTRKASAHRSIFNFNSHSIPASMDFYRDHHPENKR